MAASNPPAPMSRPTEICFVLLFALVLGAIAFGLALLLGCPPDIATVWAASTFAVTIGLCFTVLTYLRR
ncbi:hypothetical protein Val02_27070 [Virgisporangium aliadipatigenens]|uniref:Uncharacterized protein n=1 Tax=Virgisporangium aliadipatigenens TaxID=741659 RepID=A0A8J4DQC5_9ACTN|nr:hypothetical protein [Virgisporangium aliadipatigenens]GIJ45821.1 hypothetical protein Val02_27070 [Virgisporangium aliadipatigenens]